MEPAGNPSCFCRAVLAPPVRRHLVPPARPEAGRANQPEQDFPPVLAALEATTGGPDLSGRLGPRVPAKTPKSPTVTAGRRLLHAPPGARIPLLQAGQKQGKKSVTIPPWACRSQLFHPPPRSPPSHPAAATPATTSAPPVRPRGRRNQPPHRPIVADPCRSRHPIFDGLATNNTNEDSDLLQHHRLSAGAAARRDCGISATDKA